MPRLARTLGLQSIGRVHKDTCRDGMTVESSPLACRSRGLMNGWSKARCEGANN